MKVSAIVPAAGSGLRMNHDRKKQFIEIMGQPTLTHTLLKLASFPRIDEIILAAPPEEIGYCEKNIVKAHRMDKVTKIVHGGATRQDSVASAFASLSADTDFVITHDGVRPFVTHETLNDVLEAAINHGAAVAAIPVTDTIKKIKNGALAGSLRREDMVRIQTPQCFRYSILGEAIEKAELAGYRGTDESSLAERIGVAVHVVKGSEANIKITTQADLILAEAMIRAGMAS